MSATNAADSAIAQLEAIDITSLNGNTADRLKVLHAARKLVSSLETPIERVRLLTFQNSLQFAAVETCTKLGLWRAWASQGGGKKTVQELRQLAPKIEESLLRRLLVFLASAFIITEVGVDVFQPTELSLALGDDSKGVIAASELGSTIFLPASRNLAVYLAKNDYNEPIDRSNTNFSDVDSDNLVYFDRLRQSPEIGAIFSKAMHGFTKVKMDWTQIYNTEVFMNGIALDKSSLVVDIGGNRGTDLSRLLAKYPDIPTGALILQDLPDVIDQANGMVDAKIKTMVHDFLEPQPIKGSRVYFMHAILHDWPDDTCVAILKNIGTAMERGYSRLLIQDISIPDEGALFEQTSMDMLMMTLLSGVERTARAWTRLLADAGFRIVKFWPDARGVEFVIEAELA